MWTKLTALLVLLAVVTSVPVDKPERKCVEGKRYFDGCNTCYCTLGHSACTRKSCMVYNTETGVYEPANSLPPPEDYWVA